ncbi:tyrosine-type recombinase/integrase [Sodalis sp. RH16]|uniref:tyrosine-type recombinase/integrase n=1 Tax=Sodalis sp. RH16 TaxID=3394331 RepID=UPI0039B47C5B
MSIMNAILPVAAGWANPSYRRVSTWLTVYEKRLQAKNFARTTLQHKRMMLSVLNRFIGPLPIGSVTPHHVLYFLDFYVAQGKTRSAAIAHFLIKDVFREAEFSGWINKNPVTPVLVPDDVVKRDRLTVDEWQRIYLAAKFQSPDYFPLAMLLTLVTAQRRSDISAMRREQIFDDHLHIEQLKTGAKIAIPLDLRLDALGVSVREVIDMCPGNDFLLSHRQIMVHSLSHRFQAVRDAIFPRDQWLGTPPSFHEQRSLAERLYRDQGINTQRLLGHKYQRTTDRYDDDRGREFRKIII